MVDSLLHVIYCVVSCRIGLLLEVRIDAVIVLTQYAVVRLLDQDAN
jgi:hypothetical protein